MARYVKLLIDDPTTDTTLIEVGELEIYSNDVNVALNKPVTATSHYSNSVAANLTNDNIYAWIPNPVNRGGPTGTQYAIIDLQDDYVISKIVFMCMKTDEANSTLNGYRIEVSDDNIIYVNIITAVNMPNLPTGTRGDVRIDNYIVDRLGDFIDIVSRRIFFDANFKELNQGPNILTGIYNADAKINPGYYQYIRTNKGFNNGKLYWSFNTRVGSEINGSKITAGMLHSTYVALSGDSEEANLSRGYANGIGVRLWDTVATYPVELYPDIKYTMNKAININDTILETVHTAISLLFVLNFYKKTLLIYIDNELCHTFENLPDNVTWHPYVSFDSTMATKTSTISIGTANYSSINSVLNDVEYISLQQYMINSKYISNTLYKKNDEIYGVFNNNLTKINNWSTLSDDEKINLFLTTEGAPYLDELRSIEPFSMLKYNPNNNNNFTYEIKCTIFPQIVSTNKLIKTSNFKNIKLIDITGEVINGDVVGAILTNMRFDDTGINNLATNSIWNNNGVTFINEGRFGNKCATFGEGKYLKADYFTSFDYNLLTVDFTYSFWCKLQENPYYGGTGPFGYSTVLSGGRLYKNQRLSLNWEGITKAHIIYGSENPPQLTTTTEFSDNKWHHVAFVRKNKIDMIFIDGRKEYEINKLTVGKKELDLGGYKGTYIGCDVIPGDNNAFINGDLDDIVFIKGVGLWDTDFTPPSTYLSDIMNFNYDLSNKIGITTVDPVNKIYKTFDFVNNSWEDVEYENISSQGISIYNLNKIPSEKWQELKLLTENIGFIYILLNDKTHISELLITADMMGSWNSQDPYKFNYKYKNNSLNISLLEDGDYKINYNQPVKVGDK